MILHLEVLGVPQATAGLTGLLRRVSDMRPMAEPWDWRLRANAEEHFRTEGTHKGQWANLASVTQLQRMRLGYPPMHPILERTGTLKRSLIRKANSKHILEAHPHYIEFGSKVDYAIYHQMGTDKMPQRLMVAITAKTLSRMIQDLRTFLMEGHVGVMG